MHSTIEDQVPQAVEPTPVPPGAGADPHNLKAPAKPAHDSVLRPDPGFMERVEAESGVHVSACYGCKKCSNGCPVTFAMDFHPYQVVRYVQLGLFEKLLDSSTIWLCASCQTCLTRCPNDVDLPRLMDYLKEEVVRRSGTAKEPRTRWFHELFLGEVKRYGRVFEGGLMTRYMLRTGGMFGPEALDYARLGLDLLRRGRMNMLPHRISDRSWLPDLFRKEGRPKP